MFVLGCKVEIGDYVFDSIVDVKIVRSVDLLSDTAIIKLPTKFVLKGMKQKHTTEKTFKVKDPVTITLAYVGKFEHTEFRGFVSKIKPNTPIEIHCEDSTFVLRRQSHFKNFTNTTLRGVLQYITAGTGIELSPNIPDVPLENFLLKGDNGAQALNKIKEFGFVVFFDGNGKLFAGLRQTEGTGKEVTYDLDYNIVSHELEFKTAEQVKIKLKAKGWKPDNTYIEVEVGDKDGEERIWQTRSVTNEAELRKLAESQLMAMTYNGYDGTVTGFLIPFADRGMTAHIIDEEYPEREGKYFIPKVEIEFGTNGARRVVTLGRKLSE